MWQKFYRQLGRIAQGRLQICDFSNVDLSVVAFVAVVIFMTLVAAVTLVDVVTLVAVVEPHCGDRIVWIPSCRLCRVDSVV